MYRHASVLLSRVGKGRYDSQTCRNWSASWKRSSSMLSPSGLVHAARGRKSYPADRSTRKATTSSEMAQSTTAAREVEGKLAAAAQDYYSDPNVLNVHKQILGGEVHVGLYNRLEGEDNKLEGMERIRQAGVITTRAMLNKAFSFSGLTPEKCTIMDMGSAYGGAARIAAKEFGCNVVCIDVSQGENALNAEISAAAGLADKIIIPGERSYFDTEMPEESMDVVISQDSFLHAGTEQYRAIKEAARVLKPGGTMSFTDLMQSETADPKELAELYELVKIDHMANPTAYERWGKEYGLDFVEFDDQTANVSTHYHNLVNLIAALRPIEGCDDSFLDWISTRFSSWPKAERQGLVRWGILTLKKKN